jgi:hypothetical protein
MRQDVPAVLYRKSHDFRVVVLQGLVRHGILGVGHLGDNCLLVEAAGEELLDGSLLQCVVGNDGVLATCISSEDLKQV